MRDRAPHPRNRPRPQEPLSTKPQSFPETARAASKPAWPRNRFGIDILCQRYAHANTHGGRDIDSLTSAGTKSRSGEPHHRHPGQPHLHSPPAQVDPQRYLTQLLMNLPTWPQRDLDAWLPDQWKLRHAARLANLNQQNSASLDNLPSPASN